MLIGQHLVVSYSGDIVHHVQQHFQFRFQLRHYSLQPYQKPQARQLRKPEQNIQVLPVLIYTFMELRVGISQAAIEQWGINTGGAVRTSTLPIPFTNVFLAVASTSSEWCCPGCSATNTTVTTRAYQSNRPDVAQPNDVNWIIIGCQPQWGKILGDTVNLKIINFPVSFNECFGGLALFNGDPVAAAEYATITDITNTNFKIYMYANNAGTGYTNANIFYLFLGAQQQWRKDPGLWAIPFTTFVAGGITMTRSGWQGSGEWNGDSGTVSLTGYSAQCATGNSVSNIGGSAIAIGQQL